MLVTSSQSKGEHMRFLLPCAVMVLGVLGIGAASADDNDNAVRLVELFAKTCAKKPASAEALDTLARGLGYIHQHGPVPADDPTRNYDDIHSWKLRDQDSNFGISTYFEGPRAHYQVSCSLSASNVAGPSIMAVIKSKTALPDPQSTKLDSESGRSNFNWTTEIDGEQEKLDVSAATNGRASISISYFVKGH